MAHLSGLTSSPADSKARLYSVQKKRDQTAPAAGVPPFAMVMQEQDGEKPAQGSTKAKALQESPASPGKAGQVADRQDARGDNFPAADPAQKKSGLQRTRELSMMPGQMPVSTMLLRSPVLAGRSPSDILQGQLFGKAQMDIAQTRAMESMMRGIGSSPLEAARGLGTARQLRNFASRGQDRPGPGEMIKGRTKSKNRLNRGGLRDVQERELPEVKSTVSRPVAEPAGLGLGSLSARFESGKAGIAAIGYDSKGGTSYGKFQIASRVGSMKNFLDFLDSQAPDLASRLKSAGPANTGSRRGAMPDEWKAIAAEQPERFGALQESFIRESHYEPALRSITQRTSLSEDNISSAMREVIWSTAVQHGPAGAARIFSQAEGMSGKPDDPGFERKLIANVYSVRSGQFGGHTSEVQAAVQSRFRQEKDLALGMLNASDSMA